MGWGEGSRGVAGGRHVVVGDIKCECTAPPDRARIPLAADPPLPPAARRVRKRSLAAQWERLEPAARQVAAAAGVEGAPTEDDFLWAQSIFW